MIVNYSIFPEEITIASIDEYLKTYDINNVSKSNHTILTYYAMTARGAKLEILQYMVDKGANINHSHKNNITIVHTLCEFSATMDILKFLADNGADFSTPCNMTYPEHTMKFKYSALMILAKNNPNIEFFNFVINQGCPIMEENCVTVLHCLSDKLNSAEIYHYFIHELKVNIHQKLLNTGGPAYAMLTYYKSASYDIIMEFINAGLVLDDIPRPKTRKYLKDIYEAGKSA